MNLQNKTIAFIGGGIMAEALIRGLLVNKVVEPSQLIATDVRAERLEFMESTFGIRTTPDNFIAVKAAEIVILAVKPQQLGSVLAGLLPAVNESKLIISIAAGITTTRIEHELGGKVRVIRVMPNTPAQIGAGAAALCAGKLAGPADLQTAETILKAVGIAVRVDEKDIDAVTALSGSGPAYVFLVAEAMTKAGIELGLSPEISRKLARHTIFGASVLLAESAEEASDLRRKVTSPGGTTEAAIKVMTDKKLVDIFGEAMTAAAHRSKELSGV